MSTINDIVVDNVWRKVSELTQTPVGTKLKLQNKGTVSCYLFEGNQPESNSTDGEELTTKTYGSSVKFILAGSSEVWIRSSGNVSCKVAVQVG